MKIWKRTLSVGLSLVLCGSMVLPGFAASFSDLQNAINGSGGAQIEGTDRYGYGQQNEETGKWGIEAWDGEDGTRNVTLLEKVEYGGGKDTNQVKITTEKDVILDLNGQTVDATERKGTFITKENGDLTVKDSGGNGEIIGAVDVKNGDFTMNSGTINANGNNSAVNVGAGDFTMTGGKITGAKIQGVHVVNGNADISGDSIIAGNDKGNSKGVMIDSGNFAMSGNAKITGNKSYGVQLNNGSFSMSGGEISQNGAGGIYVQNGAGKTSFLTGGNLSGNKGSGISIKNGTLIMSGDNTVISDNSSTGGAGGVAVGENGAFIMNGGKITGNHGKRGGGVGVQKGSFEMNGGEISENEADWRGGGVYAEGGATVTINSEADIHDNTLVNQEGAFGASVGVYNNSNAQIAQELPDGSEINLGSYNSKSGIAESHTSSIKLSNFAISLDENGIVTITDAEGKTVDAILDANGIRVESGDTVSETLTLTLPLRLPALPPAEGGNTPGGSGGGSTGGTTDIDDPDVPLGGEPELTEIEDEAVPLAGLFTRADAIGYLWVQSGRPEAELSTFEDVPEDHEWAVAIGWAQDMGIAVADEEGNFRPDDLVLRWTEDLELDPEGEFEEFLNRYAEYAGVELEADELFVELGGEPDDIVMGEDAQVIFDNFFARLEEALAEQAA